MPVTDRPLGVVIVDDSEDLRYLLAMKLKIQGLDILGEAGDGAEGLDLITRTQPDAVLLDLAMPNMDGLEAIIEIRKRFPDMKILVLSGFEADLGQKAISLGAHAFLSKSDDLDLVAVTLKGLMGPSR